MKRNQLGKFLLSMDWFEDDLDAVAKLFCLMTAVIVGVDIKFGEKYLEYTCISPLFEPVSPGDVIPRYSIIIKNFGEDDFSVSACKIDSSTSGSDGQAGDVEKIPERIWSGT